MQAINATVRNGVFAFSFFGAALSLLAGARDPHPAAAVASLRLIALAAVLYIGGGFMVTFLVNVPMNEELARVGERPCGPRADPGGVRRPVEFWNGVRTIFSSLAFLALIGACLSRSD